MAIALTTGRQGINRYRTKGGARTDTLYDAVNCYITVSGSARPRPGTVIHDVLPAGTIGLMAYRGKLWVFASHFIDISAHDGFGLSVLTHPDPDPADPPALVRIHFAEPFLGYPYVVAEWSDGQIYHYWLQGEGDETKVWLPNTSYQLREIVHPTVANGFTYEAHRLTEPGPAWAPNVERDVNDVIEPTVENGFEYVCIEAHGNPPRSGSVEPAWPTEAGAIVIEEADASGAPPAMPPTTPPPTVPPGVRDRYGGGIGSETIMVHH